MIPESVDNSPVLVVMAAGMGSRFGGLKQLEGVGASGETLLEYSIFDALRAGFSRVVFIIREDIEALFREQVLARFESRVACSLVFQEIDKLPEGFQAPEARVKPWGTGQAVLLARDAVGRSPFVVINADDYYGSHAFGSMKHFFDKCEASGHYALAAYRLRNTLSAFGQVSRGVCHSDAQGRWLDRMEEVHGIGWNAQGGIEAGEKTFSGDEPVSMNLWGFTEGVFDLLEHDFTEFLKARGQQEGSEFYLPMSVSDSIAREETRVEILPVEDKWYGVTYREDKPEVAAALAKKVEEGIYPANLWA